VRIFSFVLTLLAVALFSILWLWRPQNSAEWAAWVQACAIVAAIVWAAWLQQRSASHGARQAAQVAALFAANMHWVFRELYDACAKRNWADYSVNRRLLEEVLAQGREASLQLLEGRSLGMVTSLRSIAVEALEVTLDHAPGHENWALLQAHFDKRLPSLAAWLSTSGHPPESSGPTDYVGLRSSLGQLGER